MRVIVTSHWSIVLTLYLWTLSSSQWRCQPGRFSMAAHRHDRRGNYRCVLFRFRGRIEIDHSYGLRCRGLCCHSRHSTRGTGRTQAAARRPAPLVLCRCGRAGRPHECCAGSGSTNHSSADHIVVNSFNSFFHSVSKIVLVVIFSIWVNLKTKLHLKHLKTTDQTYNNPHFRTMVNPCTNWRGLVNLRLGLLFPIKELWIIGQTMLLEFSSIKQNIEFLKTFISCLKATKNLLSSELTWYSC